jgi:hypothetical protein
VHDEEERGYARVHWEPDISSRYQSQDLLLCEWSDLNVDWCPNLNGREAVFGQETRFVNSKSAGKILELGRAAMIAMFAVKICVDEL